MSNINEMQEFIIARYGDTIRGKRVSSMSNKQIFAIYKSIMNRDEKERQAAKNTTAGRCGSCWWFKNGVCNHDGTNVNATSLACRKFYDNKNQCGHQLTMFETKRGIRNDSF